MPYQPPVLAHLLEQNAQWSADVTAEDPEFFVALSKGQHPKVLWIGCGDSRVPASVKMACKPGDIFTTRNVGSQVHLDDDSMQSVLAYAVEEVGIEHIIVCGHTGCGGLAGAYDMACEQYQASISSPSSKPPALNTPLKRWLAPLVKLALELRLPTLPREEALTKLLLASVQSQVENVLQAGVEFNLKPKAPQPVFVHGWTYTLETGLLQDLGISIPLR